METAKPLEFKGTAGDYFVLVLITIVFTYIPIFGWAFLLNYAAGWLADNTIVNGKKVAYTASYGESLTFMLVNGLLLIVTLGIYLFWLAPKTYRYVADHIHYVDGVAAQSLEVPVTPAPVSPVDQVVPTTPVEPIAPAAPTDPVPPATPSGTTPLVG